MAADSNEQANKLMLDALASRSPVRVLAALKKGADANAKHHDGTTPLHVVAMAGDLWDVKQLIKAGADPRIADRKRQTPIHHLAAQLADSYSWPNHYRYHRILSYILDHGPRATLLTSTDNSGKTPLELLDANKHKHHIHKDVLAKSRQLLSIHDTQGKSRD